jgi:nitrite reductase/ring-hydroxylating ferredoxin subunit
LIYPAFQFLFGEKLAKTKVAAKSDIPPGKMVGAEVSGKWLVVANVEGSYYAMDGKCNHAGGELWKGTLISYVVKCPRHGSEYDIRTGKVLKGPWIPFAKTSDEKTYPVMVEGEDIFVDA